jgi:adenylate kinase
MGLKVTSILEKGDLVPDKLTIEILVNEVKKYKKTNGFIFDGFPRTIIQAKKLDDFLKSLSMQISFTIALEAEDEILLNRLLKRGETSGRSDDTNKEKILNRFKEYNDKTLPLKEYYSKQNKFFSINGVGDIKLISERLISIIENS